MMMFKQWMVMMGCLFIASPIFAKVMPQDMSTLSDDWKSAKNAAGQVFGLEYADWADTQAQRTLKNTAKGLGLKNGGNLYKYVKFKKKLKVHIGNMKSLMQTRESVYQKINTNAAAFIDGSSSGKLRKAFKYICAKEYASESFEYRYKGHALIAKAMARGKPLNALVQHYITDPLNLPSVNNAWEACLNTNNWVSCDATLLDETRKQVEITLTDVVNRFRTPSTDEGFKAWALAGYDSEKFKAQRAKVRGIITDYLALIQKQRNAWSSKTGFPQDLLKALTILEETLNKMETYLGNDVKFRPYAR